MSGRIRFSHGASSLRAFLLDFYAARVRKNARYTMSAFARDIGLSRSSLSLILRGQQGLSEARARGIATALGLKKSETELFLHWVRREHARSQSVREKVRPVLASPAPRSKVVGQLCLRWEHLALREWSKLPEANLQPEVHSYVAVKELRQDLGDFRSSMAELLGQVLPSNATTKSIYDPVVFLTLSEGQFEEAKGLLRDFRQKLASPSVPPSPKPRPA